MDANRDKLTDLERRLAACEPSAAGLSADAMLFAAGRASARPGPARFVWPALSAGLAVLAAALGAWLAAERAERIALAERLRQPAPAPSVAPAPPPVIVPEPPTPGEPPTSSVLAARRALEQGLDAWPPAAATYVDTPGPRPPEPPVLRAGPPDGLADQ
jgi:hypothetical protein